MYVYVLVDMCIRSMFISMYCKQQLSAAFCRYGDGLEKSCVKGTYLNQAKLFLCFFSFSRSSSLARTVAETVTVKAPVANRKVSIEVALGKDSVT